MYLLKWVNGLRWTEPYF